MKNEERICLPSDTSMELISPRKKTFNVWHLANPNFIF